MKNTKMISLLVPIISVVLAFLIGCIIMAALSANPAVALQALWKGAFGSVRNIGTTLSRSTPLIFTGLCACFAYKCGVFNLGGEGQFIMGSVVCTVIATQCGFTGLPAIIICYSRRRGRRPLGDDTRCAEGVQRAERDDNLHNDELHSHAFNGSTVHKLAEGRLCPANHSGA